MKANKAETILSAYLKSLKYLLYHHLVMLCHCRQICRLRGAVGGTRKAVAYRSPCGRRLRNVNELDRFLQYTDSNMTTDLFCFDPVLHTDTEYVPVKVREIMIIAISRLVLKLAF